MIRINYRDSKPIYEQIKDGFRRLITQGIITTDEKLPSVRELATNLTINPNTIQRAYRELEADGYVYTVAGKGCFVAGVPAIDEVRKKELMDKLKEIIEELEMMGISKEDIVKEVQNIMVEREESK
ncbi:MAG: GntR family transcriptional regulator [Lachnospiraceae bacterium]|nr:GntR family transcriptional regulator [Lachnospiraceae bacterium]